MKKSLSQQKGIWKITLKDKVKGECKLSNYEVDTSTSITFGGYTVVLFL